MRILLIPILIGLSGCNPAQSQAVQACETFIKERLRSPSTYKRISVDDLGPAFESDGRRIKMLTVEYDAANAYGTPIRGSQQCVFEVDEKGRFSQEPEFAAKMSSIGADSEYSPCCLVDKGEGSSGSTSDDVNQTAADALNAADAALTNAGAALANAGAAQ